MLLAMVITLILGPSLMTICIAIMLVGWPDVARLIRGQALKLKNKDYVRASRALGASGLWIIVKQILPNCLSLIIVSFSMGVPGAIMYEAGMSFFGYGIPAPAPSLGLSLIHIYTPLLGEIPCSQRIKREELRRRVVCEAEGAEAEKRALTALAERLLALEHAASPRPLDPEVLYAAIEQMERCDPDD